MLPSTEDDKKGSTESQIEGANNKEAKMILKIKETCHTIRHECLVGIGRCDVYLGHYFEATETLKDVLLEDGEYLEAWIYRGVAYLAMGN